MTDQTFDQISDDYWVVAVQVATVWTQPQSARDKDRDGTSNPTNIDKWIDSLDYKASIALCNENRVQTQVLYGERVIVLEIKDDWAQVVIPSQPSNKDERGYPGWVPLHQLKNVAEQEWRKPETVAVINDKAWLETEFGERFMKLSYMTLLPIKGKEAMRIKVVTPHGDKYVYRKAVHIFPTHHGIAKGSGKQIVETGLAFIGLDYFWGGMSSFGYDCSGFAYAVHKANGYQIARDAGDQASAGKGVDLAELKPGDLLFFAYKEGKGKLHHVGIYYKDGKMLHSPKTGKSIEITPLAGTIYEKELCLARRYWHEAEATRK